MRYARIYDGSNELYAAVVGDKFYAIEGDIYGDYTVSKREIANPTLLVPSCPTKIVAVGKNYFDHIQEMGGDTPSTPIIFIKPTGCLLPHLGTIERPAISSRVDYEGELCFIIKKNARNVTRDRAMEYIQAYSILNDVTARDIQSADGQWTRGKGFDTFAPCGPWAVTPDELNDPHCLDITTTLNGEVRQCSNTRLFMYDIPYIMEFITACMTLQQGDIVTTGTPSGIGPMKKGDVVEVTVSGIGTLRNFVD